MKRISVWVRGTNFKSLTGHVLLRPQQSALLAILDRSLPSLPLWSIAVKYARAGRYVYR